MLGTYLEQKGIKELVEKWNTVDNEKVNKFLVCNEKYGVDMRDTYDCMYSIVLYTYSLLSAYKDYAGDIIDLDYHRGIIDEKEYTQNEILDKVCQKLEAWLQAYNRAEDYDELWDKDSKITEECKWALKLLVDNFELMWW